MEKFLGAIGNTFSSLAPFTLGLNMVGKLANLRYPKCTGTQGLKTLGNVPYLPSLSVSTWLEN